MGRQPAHSASERRANSPSMSVPTNSEDSSELKPRWPMDAVALMMSVMELIDYVPCKVKVQGRF